MEGKPGIFDAPAPWESDLSSWKRQIIFVVGFCFLPGLLFLWLAAQGRSSPHPIAVFMVIFFFGFGVWGVGTPIYRRLRGWDRWTIGYNTGSDSSLYPQLLEAAEEFLHEKGYTFTTRVKKGLNVAMDRGTGEYNARTLGIWLGNDTMLSLDVVLNIISHRYSANDYYPYVAIHRVTPKSLPEATALAQELTPLIERIALPYLENVWRTEARKGRER